MSEIKKSALSSQKITFFSEKKAHPKSQATPQEEFELGAHLLQRANELRLQGVTNAYELEETAVEFLQSAANQGIKEAQVALDEPGRLQKAFTS